MQAILKNQHWERFVMCVALVYNKGRQTFGVADRFSHFGADYGLTPRNQTFLLIERKANIEHNKFNYCKGILSVQHLF